MPNAHPDGLPVWTPPGAGQVAVTPHRTELSHLFKASAAIGTLTAWAMLGYGLFGTTVDRVYADELDAGGRFGVNFALYWPFYLLTMPILALAVLALLPRPTTSIPLACALGASAAFATWLITVNEHAYRRGLVDVALWAQLVNVAALGCLCIAWLVQPERRTA